MFFNQDQRLDFFKKKAERQRKRIQEEKLRLEIANLDKEIATLEQSRRRLYNEIRTSRASQRPYYSKRNNTYRKGNR